MDFVKVALLMSMCSVVVKAITPLEEFHVPKPFSFGYAIKDKHGEQYRQEIGDGLHTVKGSYGFKDDRGIQRQVNYIADEGGFRAEIKTNEPGTTALNPAAVKMESSAHPYFGTSKTPIAADNEKGLAFAGGFEFPGNEKFGPEELSGNGLAFDAELAKENELEKEALGLELAKEEFTFGNEFGIANEEFAANPVFAEGLANGGLGASSMLAEGFAKEGLSASSMFTEGLAKEGFASSPMFAEGPAKETGVAKGFEELLKKGFAIVPINLKSEMESQLKKRFPMATPFGSSELAKLGLIYSPQLFKDNIALDLKEAESKKEGLDFGKAFPFTPLFSNVPLKPKGFAYGGPLIGGFVKGYDARYY